MSPTPIHDALSFAAQAAGNKPVETTSAPSSSVGTTSSPATGAPVTVSASASAAATSAATGQAVSGAAQTSETTAPPVETSTAGTQALAGSHEIQPPSAQDAQAFHAPRLHLPDDPSARDVLDGLAHAMADPTINQATADRLFQIHQQLMDAQKAMIAAATQG